MAIATGAAILASAAIGSATALGGAALQRGAAGRASGQTGDFEDLIRQFAEQIRQASQQTGAEKGRETRAFGLERQLGELFRRRAGIRRADVEIPSNIPDTERRLINDIRNLEREIFAIKQEGGDASRLEAESENIRNAIRQRLERGEGAPPSVLDFIPEPGSGGGDRPISGEDLLREGGPITSRFLDEIAARQGLTGEELFGREGEIPSFLQEEISRRIQDPGGTFESTLQEQLELARTSINAEANRRGVFGGAPEGGIRFEQLGRSGIDLAIKSALEREAARQQDIALASGLSTQFLNLSAQRRQESSQVGAAALGEAAGARSDIFNFLSNIQNLSQASRQRQVQGVAAGAQLAAGGAGTAFGARQELAGIQFGQGAATTQQGLALTGRALIPEPQTNFNIRLGNRSGRGAIDIPPAPDFSNITLRR